MLILGLDFETTGLDIHTVKITEVGAILWDTVLRQPVQIMSRFVWNQDYPPQSEEVIRVSGITDDMLKTHGMPAAAVMEELAELMSRAEAVMAHNGNNYDKPILERVAKEMSVQMPYRPWIDSSTDLPLPETLPTCRKLTHLAFEHGIHVEQRFCHRAFYDVLLMLEIASRYAIDDVMRIASAPVITVRAKVTIDEREKAKARRFQWDPQGKLWLKRIRDFDLEKETKACQEAGFGIVQLQERKA